MPAAKPNLNRYYEIIIRHIAYLYYAWGSVIKDANKYYTLETFYL